VPWQNPSQTEDTSAELVIVTARPMVTMMAVNFMMVDTKVVSVRLKHIKTVTLLRNLEQITDALDDVECRGGVVVLGECAL